MTSNVLRAFLCFIFLTLASAVHADVILDWNKALSDVLRADTTIQNPGMGSRSMAMTNIAMYDAINGVSPSYQPMYQHPSAPANASKAAAALQAGYRVLSSIYPGQQSLLDARRSAILATLPNDQATTNGLNYGDTVGAKVVQQRSNDGFNNVVLYQHTNLPGHWQADPLNPSQGVWGPEWGQLETFAVQSSAHFKPPRMPDLTSPEYTHAFNEVKQLGAVNSTTRTLEQTEIGRFWAYDRLGMGTPMRLFNAIMRTVATDQGNSLDENALMFAMASTAAADAGITAWDAKFEYDFWRPVTGIREADTDGNPLTIADPSWTPMGAPGGTLADGTVINDFTPPFPTYISGHATFSGALFQAMANFYGTDDISFSATSDEVPGVVRSYTSFSEAAIENGRSRVYLGIHWDFDDFIGREAGIEVANYISSNSFQPIPEPTSAYLVVMGGLAVIGLARKRRAGELGVGCGAVHSRP